MYLPITAKWQKSVILLIHPPTISQKCLFLHLKGMRNYKPYNEDKMNTYGKIYKWEVACCLGRATFTFDDKELGHADLNPIGTGGDYICYPQLGNTGQEAAPTGQMTYARRHPHPARPRAKGNWQRDPPLHHNAWRKAIKRLSRSLTCEKKLSPCSLFGKMTSI